MVANQPQAAAGRYQYKVAASIWFVAAVIDLLLAGDFVVRLLGATKSSAFVNFIYQVSAIFSTPFHGIWPAVTNRASYFDPADLVAIVVYAVIGWGLITLVKIMTAPRGTKPDVGA
jgi:uncharacterized protein YggT (Ycf19 family)